MTYGASCFSFSVNNAMHDLQTKYLRFRTHESNYCRIGNFVCSPFVPEYALHATILAKITWTPLFSAANIHIVTLLHGVCPPPAPFSMLFCVIKF